MPMPALNIIATQDTVRNSGSSSSRPSGMRPYRPAASQTTNTTKAEASSTNSQPRLVSTHSRAVPLAEPRPCGLAKPQATKARARTAETPKTTRSGDAPRSAGDGGGCATAGWASGAPGGPVRSGVVVTTVGAGAGAPPYWMDDGRRRHQGRRRQSLHRPGVPGAVQARREPGGTRRGAGRGPCAHPDDRAHPRQHGSRPTGTAAPRRGEAPDRERAASALVSPSSEAAAVAGGGCGPRRPGSRRPAGRVRGDGRLRRRALRLPPRGRAGGVHHRPRARDPGHVVAHTTPGGGGAGGRRPAGAGQPDRVVAALAVGGRGGARRGVDGVRRVGDPPLGRLTAAADSAPVTPPSALYVPD